MAASAHDIDEESQALLASSDTPYNEKPVAAPSARRRFGLGHLAAAFLLGGLSSVGLQSAYTSVFLGPAGPLSAAHKAPQRFGAPWAGSTQVQPFPPASPTNTFPELFPTDVGYAGPTPTGAEPALVATAPVLPVYTQAPHLVPPVSISGGSKPKNQTKAGWDLFKHWGNLSPWYSNERGAFGIQAGGEAPEGCAVTGLHLLHRHGARYPTGWASYGGPANLAGRLHKSTNKWTAKGELEFLNDWTYKLGEEILTPFGRQQLYDLGVSIRMKYGFLLNNFTESNTIPVFRTESQDRMLASAQNFALGFFGYPIEGQYQQSITIEASNFNNTLAPYMTCPAANDRSKGDRGTYYVTKWAEKYLADARGRLDSSIDGYDISIEDTFTMQQLCAYETVAIGYSKFCELFTEEEWEGFDYALDLSFWYNSAFGSPVGRVQGIGWVQEFVARLTHTPIQTHNSSTNSTLDDDPRTFPLGQALYVDATHEVVVLNVLTALNLSTLAATGPLPADHIPKDRSFVVSRLAPFSTNVQFQQLYCPSEHTPEQIRVIVNDGVVPLSGLGACGSTHDGRCALPAFVDGLKTLIAETDWNWGCNGRWTVPQGDEWETVVGYPPAKPHSA